MDERVPESCVVFTPDVLANAIVRRLGDDPTAEWLDPCVGQGALVNALARNNVPRERIRALDIEALSGRGDLCARTLRSQEFLAWSLKTDETFSRLIANPPFAALAQMPRAVRDAAEKVAFGAHLCTTGASNTWAAFLVGSLRLLRPGGKLSFILPAAWDYADYAGALRQYLPRHFDRFEVHRSRKPLFPGIQEGSVVLIAEGFRREMSAATVSRSLRLEHKDLGTLSTALASDGVPVTRGSTIPSSSVTTHDKPGVVRLSSVLDIRIGAVTGDARFFVLSDEERTRQELPEDACVPVLSRARHLVSGRMRKREWLALKARGERVWLFRPEGETARQTGVKGYLDLTIKSGGCNRKAQKIRKRDLWYQTPLPTKPDGFISGMSSWGPWVVFNRMKDLSATNTLYVVNFKDALSLDEQAGWAMWLLTREAEHQLQVRARRYADGLVKYEPGDIASLRARAPANCDGAYDAYLGAVEKMLDGERAESRELAETWFE